MALQLSSTAMSVSDRGSQVEDDVSGQVTSPVQPAQDQLGNPTRRTEPFRSRTTRLCAISGPEEDWIIFPSKASPKDDAPQTSLRIRKLYLEKHSVYRL